MTDIAKEDERAREVLAATGHMPNCASTMTPWDMACYTPHELSEIECTCGQVERAMQTYADTLVAEAVAKDRAALTRACKVIETLAGLEGRPVLSDREREDGMIVAMMYALHAHVPEIQRPMSMSDLSDEQAERARNAVCVILGMATAIRDRGKP